MAVALGSVLALTATACGDDGSGAAGDKGDEGSGKGSITFWDNNGGVRTDIWKQIIADFEKKNPDIKVKYVGIPAASAQSKYDTAIQGGGCPTSAVWGPRCSRRSRCRGVGAVGQPAQVEFPEREVEPEPA